MTRTARPMLRGRWLGEPLLHFALLGAGLFFLYRQVAPADARRIVVSEAVLRGLRQDHLRRAGGLPTAAEERALIERYVDNEVLLREALALGLDRGDIIVRRRLIQKMEFLSETLAPLPEPTDADLQAYLDAHAARYATPGRVTLRHVFVGTDRHGADAEATARRLHQQLEAGADAAGLGEPFPRGLELTLASEHDLAGTFGAEFAARVMTLPLGVWSEPVRSSYGYHLVHVAERRPGTPPALATVRTEVEHDWQEERRQEAHRTLLARLRAGYTVVVERGPGS